MCPQNGPIGLSFVDIPGSSSQVLGALLKRRKYQPIADLGFFERDA